jgi:membrane associated rhomboid family serine protease
MISGLATLWQFADPKGAIGLLAIHGVSRELIFTQPWRLMTTALLHGGILHFVFNALWAVRLGVPFESRYGNRASLIFLLLVTPFSVLCTVMFGNATIGLSGWGFGLGGWMLVARRYDQRLQHSVSDESMGTLVVWFALGFVLSWLRVLPIDNVAHTAGGSIGALSALWTYRSEWKRSRSMSKRRRAWKSAMNSHQEAAPDAISVGLRDRDLESLQPAFENPELAKHTPVEMWDEWTEELVANGDEKNAQRTLSVAITLGSSSGRPMRLMRLSNLQYRSGEASAALDSLTQVNAAQLRPDERELSDALRERSS